MQTKSLPWIMLFLPLMGISQTYEDMVQKGLKYKNENRYIEALAMFQVLLKTDSSNVIYLTNTSILFSRAGNLQVDQKKKMDYFSLGEYLAKKSIATDKNQWEAHYAYALALGRKNENASSKEKIANAKLIRTEAETAIRLNPTHAGSYHILGRWHSTVAGFGVIEKIAINTLYGGVPDGGSYDAAIDCFKNAIKHEPFYILHYYELASSYKERGNKGDAEEAKKYLRHAISLPNTTPEDPETKKKCARLLAELE